MNIVENASQSLLRVLHARVRDLPPRVVFGADIQISLVPTVKVSESFVQGMEMTVVNSL